MVSAKNVTQYELKMQAERKWIGTGMVDAYLLLFFFLAKMTCKFSVVPR